MSPTNRTAHLARLAAVLAMATVLTLPASTRAEQSESVHHMTSARKLIHTPVANEQGQPLGVTFDAVLGSDRQKVEYVAMTTGGFLGLGAKFFAVPMESARPSWAHERLIVSAYPNQLLHSAGFNPAQWPDKAQENWMISRDQTQPSEGMPGSTFWSRRVSRLLGLPVVDGVGQPLGTIHDLKVNAADGRVTYAIVAYGGFLGLGQKLAPIPWPAVKINPYQRRAQVDTTLNTLESISYVPGQEPALGHPERANRIHKVYKIEPAWIAQ